MKKKRLLPNTFYMPFQGEDWSNWCQGFTLGFNFKFELSILITNKLMKKKAEIKITFHPTLGVIK